MVVLLLLEYLPAVAQVLPFRNYTSRDGLLSNYSLALCNDSRGYLWIGSNDGLSRYDGISFLNYTVADGLAFSRVTCIRESQQHPGTLWIGTNGGGISMLESGHFTNFTVGLTTWSNSIGSIAEDHTGHIWAATSEGLFYLHDGAFVQIPLQLPRTNLAEILMSPDSSLWIVTDSRIFSYSLKSELTHVIPILVIPGIVFEACTVGHDGNVWLSTSNGQLLRVRKEKVVETLRTGLHFHDFLMQDSNGSLWAGADEGIVRIAAKEGSFGKGQMIRYTTQNGLRDPLVVDCVRDREGDLWLAYSSNGIAKLSDFSVITNSLHILAYPPNNTSAFSDSNRHIWVCSDSSLREYWNNAVKGWENVRHDELRKGMHRSPPLSLYLDHDQCIWVVLKDSSILQYHLHSSPNGSSHLNLLNVFRPGVHFPRAIPMFVYRDDNGLLWCSMADNRGVFLLNPQKQSPFLREYTSANGLPDNSVRAIYEDRHRNIWFGGYSDGLSMLPSDEPLTSRFRLFTTAQGLPNTAIRAITEDSLGTLWVGTRYGGLAYFQDSLFHPVSLRDGLVSTAVWCLVQGSQKRLWVGTQMGMQSLLPVSLTFSTKQDWNGDPVYACGETSPGHLWFVSTAGLTMYDASRDRNDTVPPPVHVTHFEVNGVAFPPTGSFELSSSQDNCSIEVSGISLRDEGNLRYQFKLLGANNDQWRQPRKDRTFVFASLSPGSYTFMVRAINSSGFVSSIPATVQFTILPPFWKQWWFVVGTSLCFILLAMFIIRLRVGRLLAIERLRSGIATDLHDDIGSGLTRIAILSDVAYRQVQSGQQVEGSRGAETDEVLGALEKVRGTARGLIDTMSDVVWAIDPAHDSFERLVQRLRSFAYELCEGKNIKLKFHSADEVTSAKMSSEGMRNVLLLSKEALTNIAKHSHCTTAEVSLNIVDRRLVIEISDSGRGFDPSRAHAGNGLGNMRKRTQLAGATYELLSEPGKGTRIVASFPLSG